MNKFCKASHLKLLLVLCFLLLKTVSFAQGNVKITLIKEKITTKEALEEVAKQAKLSIAFNESKLGNEILNFNIEEKTLDQALITILAKTNFAYRVKDGYIMIIPREEEKGSYTMKVDYSFIQGQVLDNEGKPLPGVSVVRKGTTKGVQTDLDGKFKFPISEFEGIASVSLEKSGKTPFVFSFIGMETKEVDFTGQKNWVVRMEEIAGALDEVVVTGYQKMSRRDLVGSYTTIKPKDISMPSVTSIDQMLQGQVAGMLVTNSSMRAGSTPSIMIRGKNTLLGQTSPLWVVDGIIINNEVPNISNSDLVNTSGDDNFMTNYLGSAISWLNPSDIESITILKDASATAVYGAQASNGVIVITTNRGKSERLSIRYSSNFSLKLQQNYDNYNVMNSQERINFSKEATDAGAFYTTIPYKQPYTYEGLSRMYIANELTDNEFKDAYNYLETVNTDWFKILTRNALSHNHNLSVSGGNQKSNYLASFSYAKDNGLETGNSSDRYTTRLASRFELTNNIKVDFAIGASMSKTKGFISKVNPLNYAKTTSRSIPVIDQFGDPIFYKKANSQYAYNSETQVTGLDYNILNELEHTGVEVVTPNITSSLNLSWKLSSAFTYEVVGGYTFSNNRMETYAGERSYYTMQKYRGYTLGTKTSNDPEYKAAILPFGGELITSNSSTINYNIQNKLLFSKQIGSDHRFNSMLAWEIRSGTSTSKYNTIWGYTKTHGEGLMAPTPPDRMIVIGPSLPLDKNGIFNKYYDSSGAWLSSNTKNNFLSGFFTFAYSFKNRYVVNLSARNDISNRFGSDANNKIDPTYSFGASWNIAEESIFKPIKSVLSQLNIRASYGIQGNLQNKFSPEMLIKSTNYVSPEWGQSYALISQIRNDYLTWERSHTLDLGVDFSLFKGFISGVIDYYAKESDAVSIQNTGPELGEFQAVKNGNIITNKGIEVSLNLTPIQTKDFALTISTNWAKNFNTVVEAQEIQGLTTSGYILGQNNRVFEENYSLGSFWAYSFSGLNPENGYPIIRHINNDEKQDEVNNFTDFLVYAGNNIPDITAGLNLNIRYKSFGISSMFAAVLGQTAFLDNPYLFFSSNYLSLPQPDINLSKDLMNRWKKPGDEVISSIPSIYTDGDMSLRLPRVTRPLAPVETEKADLYRDIWAHSDVRLVDASFLRCRQISFSWYMNSRLLKILKLSNLSLSATVSNVFVLASSKWNGMDPELKTAVLPRAYTFGISLGL